MVRERVVQAGTRYLTSAIVSGWACILESSTGYLQQDERGLKGENAKETTVCMIYGILKGNGRTPTCRSLRGRRCGFTVDRPLGRAVRPLDSSII